MARFFVDNDFPLGAGNALQHLGHDIESARSTNREHCHDDDQLLYATTENRILITHNRRDFRLLHDAWQRWSQAWGVQRLHGGILVLGQGLTYREYAAIIDAYLTQSGPVTNEFHLHDSTGQWTRPSGP